MHVEDAKSAAPDRSPASDVQSSAFIATMEIEVHLLQSPKFLKLLGMFFHPHIPFILAYVLGLSVADDVELKQ